MIMVDSLRDFELRPFQIHTLSPSILLSLVFRQDDTEKQRIMPAYTVIIRNHSITTVGLSPNLAQVANATVIDVAC
jgi:hypothetical protein